MSTTFDQSPAQPSQENLPLEQDLSESLSQNVYEELGEISELESRDLDPALDDLTQLMAETQSTNFPSKFQ